MNDARNQKGIFPAPGIEPGPAGWEPAILTTRPCRILRYTGVNFLQQDQATSFHPDTAVLQFNMVA